MKIPFSSWTPSKGFTKWFLILFAIACVAVFVWGKFYSTVSVVLGGETFIARVADTQAKRSKGLGGSSPLQQNEAMLFLFPTVDHQTFWMKDMVYPIDIIWFTDGRIVDIAPRVAPPLDPDSQQGLRTYNPRLPVDNVIEVPSGTVDRLNLKIGDPVKVVDSQNY